MLKILIFSPLLLPFTIGSRYSGIEKLATQFAGELSKRGHDTTLLAHKNTSVSKKVILLPYEPQIDTEPELRAFQTYQSKFYDYDVILDFGHLHLIARFMPSLPTVNLIWHDPKVLYPKAPYNIVAPSNWAVMQFRRFYHQDAKYHQSICIDVDVYRPLGVSRNDRFLCVGRMGAEKGNLEAALLCKELDVPLDIITASETKVGEISDYAKRVMAIADGKKIKIWWEKDYTEESKIKMMQTNKALLYVTQHAEVTSHKIQECLLCGQPVIVPALGALPEIVTNGVDGYLCSSKEDYIKAIKEMDKLKPAKTYERLRRAYSIENVVENNLPLYEQVKRGLRWK